MTSLRMKRTALASVMAFAIGLAATNADATPAAELNTAKTDLRNGRVYMVGFPQTKTRKTLRAEYMGTEGVDAPTAPAKYPLLLAALGRAVRVRTDEALQIASTQAEDEEAQKVAWEALEALLQGQLVTGNGNLLKGLRVAFPTDAETSEEKPGGETLLPVGAPGLGNGLEYNGANIVDLAYARLHFLRGMTAALVFQSNDRTGELRAIDNNNLSNGADNFPQYTEFTDSNFGTGPRDIQTAGYLLGNTLDRYGKAVVGMGDRLWRAAYFDRQRAPGGSRAAERQQMLNAAMSTMQEGIHAQYLAVLPLAATLEDGEGGTMDEYQECRLEQVRVSAATAANFIDRIRRGELPKIDDLGLNGSKANIDSQLSVTGSLKAAAEAAYNEAETRIWKRLESDTAAITDAQNIRTQFGDQLVSACNIDPGTAGEEPYFGLTTDVGRQRYREALFTLIQTGLNAQPGDPLLTNSGELGKAILSLRLAQANIASARGRLDAVPQQIRIEEKRNNAVNGILVGGAEKIAAYQLAIGIASSVTVTATAGVSCGTPPAGCPSVNAGIAVTKNLGAIKSAELQGDITRAQAIQTVQINNANAEATIRNLLLNQNQAILDMEAAAIQGQLAIADVNAILARIDRVFENQTYYLDTNDKKWYSDPALVFEQDRSELEYQDALNAYVISLYRVSELLESRWAEPFSNPVAVASGSPRSLDAAYDGFTQAESVFNTYRVSEATSYFLALKQWDNLLRTQLRNGGYSQTPVDNVVSIRQDILGLSDYDFDGSVFRENEARKADNIRLFRALLTNSRVAGSSGRIRFEFPMAWGQTRKLQGVAVPSPLLSYDTASDWNIRLNEISVIIDGNNTAPGSVNNRYRIDLYQYGAIQLRSYLPRGRDPITDRPIPANVLSWDLGLYYPDPVTDPITPFSYTLSAGVNGATAPSPLVLSGREPTPFAQKWILVMDPAVSGPINLLEIDDIRLALKWSSGMPPAFAWPI